MHRHVIFGIGLLALACSEPVAQVATEDIEGADLRLIVARTGREAEVRALAPDVPYRFELEPLRDVFDRGDSLRVWVLAYSTATIEAQFPGLAGRGTADIIAALKPELGPLGASRFVPPLPDRILHAQIEDGSDSEVVYQPRQWSEVADDLELHVRLDGDLACPPVGVRLRVFKRSDPGQVCIFTRAESCEWARSGGGSCPNQMAIFGAEGRIVQQPDGSLRVGDQTCTTIEIPPELQNRGESAIYDCGGRTVAMQEQPSEDWTPSRGPEIRSLSPTFDADTVAVAGSGLVFATTSGGLELRRGNMTSGEWQEGLLQHVQLDSAASSGAASSVDGFDVTLDSGAEFARPVRAQDQCLRRGADPSDVTWAGIASIPARTRLTLALPGLAPFSGAADWDVIGKPGPLAQGPFELADVILPDDLGSPRRVSAAIGEDAARLALHAADRTLGVEMSDGPGVYCPVTVVRPDGLLGAIIAGPDAFYALRADGVQVMDASGAPTAVLSNEGATFTSSWRLTRNLTEAGVERVFAFNGDTLHLFSVDGNIHHRIVVDGTIVTVLPGPRVLYRPDDQPSAVAIDRVQAGMVIDTALYIVPGFMEDQRSSISVLPGGVRYDERAKVVLFSTGRAVGVLDLLTGLSSDFSAEEAEVKVAFADPSTADTWGVVTNFNLDIPYAVRFPPSPAR